MSSYSATCQASGTGYASTEPFYKRYSSGDILSGALTSLPTTERLTDLACRMTKALSIITVFKYGVYYVDKKLNMAADRSGKGT